jgi:uncharacterized protein (TIGR02246 family)
MTVQNGAVPRLLHSAPTNHVEDPMSQSDDRAVRAVLDEIYAAFTAGDAEAYASSYVQDATVVMPGMWLPDRAALQSTMEKLFAGPLAGATGLFDVQSIRYPTADTAIVVSRGRVRLAGEPPTGEPADQPWLDTWVLAREPDRWRVAAFHSCPEHALGD